MPAAGQESAGASVGVDGAPVPDAELPEQEYWEAAVAYCFDLVGFGKEPVPVAKTPDLAVVLADVRWGYNPAIGCYLVIDGRSQEVLRASTADLSLDVPTEEDRITAEHCFATRARFGITPVDIAKTVDHSRVLAQVKWGYNDTIGCYLVLNNNALAALQAAAQQASIAQSEQEQEPDNATIKAEVASAEAEMVDLVNGLREGLGLEPLANHDGLADVARRWSQTMAAADDFRHNPDYAEQYPPGWRIAAENISWQSGFNSLSSAVRRSFNGLVDSPGHYANMTHPNLTHIGVGIAVDGGGGFWLTQNFAHYSSTPSIS